MFAPGPPVNESAAPDTVGAAPPGTPGLQLVARDLPFYAVANGSQAVAGFLGLALFTRWLSPAEYGAYALTVTTATVTELVVFSWVSNATLRYLPTRERDDRAEHVFLATNFITTCTLLVFVSVLCLSVATVLRGRSDALATTMHAGLLVLTARVLFCFAVGVVRVRRLTRRYAAYVALAAFGSLGLAAALRLTVGTGANGILCMVAIAMGAPAVRELTRAGAFGWMRRRHFVPGIARQSAAYGLPLAGATFGAVVLSVADRYMLEYFRGPRQVGAYSAGYDLADKSLKLVFTVLVASSFPVVMEVLSRHGVVQANTIINRTMRIYLVWMVPLTVGVVVFRREVVDLVLGRPFADAANVVPWVAGGTLLWGATQILSQAFQVQERTSPLLYWLVGAAALNVGLNLWAIPALGMVGAAVATTLSYAAYLLVLWVRRVRHAELSFVGVEVLVVVVAGIAMYAAMSLLPVHPDGVAPATLKLASGVAVYAAVLRLLLSSLLSEACRDVGRLIRVCR